MFEDLPLELHEHIVALACTGFLGFDTGASVRLVSRYFATLAEPFRYVAVLLSDAHRIARLANALKMPAYHNAVVHHLFLSLDFEPEGRHAETPQIRYILCRVAPTLQSLIVLAESTDSHPVLRQVVHTVLNMQFPQLSYITVGDASVINGGPLPQRSQPLYPNLRYLHIVHNNAQTQVPLNFVVATPFLLRAGGDAPVHMRFSGVRFTGVCIRALRLFSGLMAKQELKRNDPALALDFMRLSSIWVIPESMRGRLVVQPVEVLPEVGRAMFAGNAGAAQEHFVAEIQALSRSCEESGATPELVVLPPGPPRRRDDFLVEWRCVRDGVYDSLFLLPKPEPTEFLEPTRELAEFLEPKPEPTKARQEQPKSNRRRKAGRN
ncbi:hypothetical protein NEOLEDRAFT_1134222 [Neolentinus lepideus HHB14362 ss-1]|uniref:Uncharacterized protein n=1 Tax=Neolentinus lepideus HHB14362 ss-1 TaxID=1314782 RepID=A0A165SDT1_9AGAM|nr:hypothetical protein NEOLEDRAFT_1134222 [Neolentinus lepideus HHB14362 ss-1]